MKRLVTNLSIPLLGIYPRETKTHVYTKTSTQMFTAGLFARTRRCRQSSCLSTNVRRSKLWSTHTMEYYSAIRRQEAPLFPDMDAPQNRDAQFRKPDTKSHREDDSMYRKCPDRQNVWRQKEHWWLPRAGAGDEERLQWAEGSVDLLKMIESCTQSR